jgi:MarR family transcriptional regulator, organic hydroperoxide resistance regulator
MNSSDSERFELLYRRIWAALNRPGPAGLSHHETQVLHHLTAEPVALTWLAAHLGLPKSTTSVLVKGLAARGFVERARDPGDERRLAITLTAEGRRKVEQDTVLEPEALRKAMEALDEKARAALLTSLEQLATAAESVPARPRTQADQEPGPGSIETI